MRAVKIENVPQEVINDLNIQSYDSWLSTNYCDYYPKKVNFRNDKIVRYHQLENGDYVIEKTYYQS